MDQGVGPAGGGERGVAVVAMNRREMATLIAAFAAVYVVWGSTYLGIAWAVETIPPFLMIGVRCLLAGAVLYGWARWRGGPRPSWTDWRAALLAGVLLFVMGQAVLAWAETRIASGAASLLVATEPLFIALLAWLGSGWTGAPRHRPGVATVGAILLGFVGVGVMVLPGAGGALDPLGAGAALFAALSWSIGMYRAGVRPGLGAGQVAGMQLLMSAMVLLPLAVVAGEVAGLPPGGPSARSLLSLLYLTIMGSVVTFGAYVWLLGKVGPARLSTHAYVNPVVAVVLGAVLGNEPVTAGLVIASAMILLSVAVLVRPPRSGAQAKATPPPVPQSPCSPDEAVRNPAA